MSRPQIDLPLFMFLDLNNWNGFSAYLTIDKKIKVDLAIKSRYRILCEFFVDKSFTRENFNVFILQLKQSKKKEAYLNKFISLAKHIASFHKILGFSDYTYFHEKQELYEPLTPDEIKKLAEVVVPYSPRGHYNKEYSDRLNLRNKSLVYLLGTSGLRIAEALSLKWSEVCPEYIHILETKNGEERLVPIAPFVYELLQQLPKNDTVFGVKNHQEINLDLKRRRNVIELKKDVWCHLLRHSFATTMLFDADCDPLMLAKIMGHKSTTSTMRYDKRNIRAMSNALAAHPLLKQTLTFEAIKCKVKEIASKLIDTSIYTVSVEENSTDFLLKVTAQATKQ